MGIQSGIIVPPGTACPSGYAAAPSTAPVSITLEQQIAEQLGLMQTYPEGVMPVGSGVGNNFGVVAVAQYLTADDCFRVDVLTTVPLNGLWLALRTMSDQGQITYSQTSLDTAILQQLTSFLIPMSQGWLLNATVSYTGQNLASGACLVSFGMQHSNQANQPWELILSAGFVASGYGIAWPSTSQGVSSILPAKPPGLIFVRQKAQASAAAKPISASFTQDLLAGSMLLVNYTTRHGISNLVNIADTLNSSWVSALPSTHSQYGAVFYAWQTTGGADTITVTETDIYDQLLQIYEVAGFGSGAVLVANANGADATTLTPTTATTFPGFPGDWVFASCWVYNSNGSVSPRVPFTTLEYEHGGVNPLALCGAAYTVSVTGLQTVTFDLSATGNLSSASLAVFRGS